jgi:hypothetical protein
MNELEPLENLSFINIFTKIWTSPRKVFKYINDNKYDKYSAVIVFLLGVKAPTYLAILTNGGSLPTWVVYVLCIVMGGVVGWVMFYLFALAISSTCDMFKGKGDIDSMLRVLAYAMIPALLSFVISIILFVIYKNGWITVEADFETGMLHRADFLLIASINLIFTIWSIVLYAIAISEVEKFSVVKSILILLLMPLLLIFGRLGRLTM